MPGRIGLILWSLTIGRPLRLSTQIWVSSLVVIIIMMYKDTYYITNKNLKYFFVSLFRWPPGPRALLACLSCRYAGPVISGAVISETSGRPPGISPDVDPPTAEGSVLAPLLGQQTSPPGAWSYSNRGRSPNHNRVNGVLWRDGFCEGTNHQTRGLAVRAGQVT